MQSGTTTGTAGAPPTGTPGGPVQTPPGDAQEALGAFLPEWLFVPGWQYVVAAVVLVVGYALSQYASRVLGRRVARRFRRQSVAQTVLRLIRFSVMAVAVAVAVSVLGFEFGDIVLSVTVFSAVLGVVLAPLVGSIISGLFILADEPYEIGDMIELEDGRKGFVDEITIRYTKVYTLDNTSLVVPNANMRDRFVTNYSAEDERIRLTLKILVTYESDVSRARTLLENAASDVGEVIEGGPDIRVGSARYPAQPTAYIDEFADNGVLIALRYWAKKPYKLLTVRSRIQTKLWERFDADPDVEMAYPHQHVVFDDTSGTLRAEMAPNGEAETPIDSGADAAGNGDEGVSSPPQTNSGDADGRPGGPSDGV
ncbi:mechanosensitive ion channel family protein [Halopelagius longus]|uniref:Mechanosensitive ion channel family protein n=1 Tax=Halopelagius longus TaxID=1236180 RepID=A0A1H0YYY4_9EURY|nr:mechanosensitive ion channel family protein [Halopelagius longus]RDI72745.1 mechanosensitive ion channel family protein [Halopelagius longus]SDQ20402.1 Small-conductance mechanosensitive channel [Halopelagius longus]